MKRLVGCAQLIFMFFMSFMVHSSALTQQKPVFRARIDLIQLDVTVLDRNGQPVRGLTKDDFTLLEDNRPQAIEGFTAIDVPDRVVGGPVWADRVAADVASNEIDNARIFVLVIDDGFGVGADSRRHFPDPWAIKEMKKTVGLFVDSMGPQDLTAIAFTGTTSKYSQNLTSDRRKLLDAIEKYPQNDSTLWMDPEVAMGGGTARRLPIPPCLAHKEILRLIGAIVEQLSSLPDRRKSVVYFGGQMPWSNAECGTQWMWKEVFAAAQQGSVTINPIQTAGLRPFEADDAYRAVAENTGGYAVVGTNDFAPGVKRIFTENSSYYLLAYEPTRDIADGTFRRITVTVKGRPDVEVVTKRNYWAPRQRPADEAEPPPPSPAVKALAGLLPDSKLALRVTAAPFADPGGGGPVIALALGIRQPAFAERTPEQVELLIRSFTVTGDPKASDDQMIPITVPGARADQEVTRYEVLARLDVAKPGQYQVRLSANSTASGVRGSVYVDVTVPDFAKDKLSLSGLVMSNALATTPVAPARVLRDLTPLAPTTERTFATSDIVTACLRIYQGGNDKLAPVTMKVTMTDAAGATAFSKADTLAADAFGAARAADYQFRVPLTTLKAGQYLLSFDAAAGKTTARRDVQFQVK